jgi:drug/metabolite transporter (DMT)-like permease
MIITGNMAIQAQMNPGIAYGLISTSIIMAAAYNWIVFDERITIKMCFGIIIVVASVMWLSLISGENEKNIIDNPVDCNLSTADLTTLKLQTIGVGLILSFISSLRPIQARWVDQKLGYQPFDFSVDSGFITGILLFFISGYFYLSGHPAYTAANIFNSLLRSSLMTMWGLTGLYSMVKGQMAPSMAIQ